METIDQARRREVESALRDALAIAAAYPDQPARIAAACNELGVLSQSTGNYLEAEHLFRRALAIVEGSDERGGAMAATLYRNLAALEHARGNYERGLAPARKACQIRAKLAGPDHPDTIEAHLVLAKLHDGLGHSAESRKIYRDALAKLEEIHGRPNPEIAVCLDRLAAMEHADGRIREAIGLYRRALAIETELLGRMHPDAVRTARGLALAERDLGGASRAHRLIGRLLDRFAGYQILTGPPGDRAIERC